MTDEEIKNKVNLILSFYLKGVQIKQEDIPVIQAAIDLATNLLININEIATNGRK